MYDYKKTLVKNDLNKKKLNFLKNFFKNKKNNFYISKIKHKKKLLTENKVKTEKTILPPFLNLLKLILVFIFSPIILIFNLLKVFLENNFKFLQKRTSYILLFFLVLFIFAGIRLTNLQINGFSSILGTSKTDLNNIRTGQIILARRGNIYINDEKQNKNDIALTTNEVEINLFVDAENLRNMVIKGVDFAKAIMELTSRTNLSYNQITKDLFDEINKDRPNKHYVIANNLNSEQKQAVEFLKTSNVNKTYNFQYWLGFTEKIKRFYPEKTLLSATVGYTPLYAVSSQEINQRIRNCQKMVLDNIARNTDTKEYMAGIYGIEQKFCSELGGLNGKSYFGFNKDNDNISVVNGADIYLTIDINIQKKAEQILKDTVLATTNSLGGPKDGTIVVMEAKTGKILALASYPFFDPNDYQKAWLENPLSFRNVATSVDYEAGSVLKPITLATALNAYENNTMVNGSVKGISYDFKFDDYPKGKIYQEFNGRTLTLTNADGRYFGKNLTLKEIIRDSINTGIAEIVDKTGSTTIKDYFENKFKFGKNTAINLPGDENGNIKSLNTDFNCIYCYASFGFGQGFSLSPIQLLRAYSVFANDGYLVEPYLIDSIKYKDGTIDNGSQLESPIYKEKPTKIISTKVSQNVLDYMKSVVEEGFLGVESSNAKVKNYECAGKTGTAEVNRAIIKVDAFNKPVLDENGNKIYEPCNYDCNRKRGIYDNTFVGMCPAKNPQLITLVKLSEPNPGKIRNYAGSTVGKPFSEIMDYTLNYKNITKDY